MFVRHILTALLGCVMYAGSATCNEQPAFVVERDVPIEAMLGGQFALVVDVGRLPRNSKGRIGINLVNNNSIHFPVDELKVGCSCTSATLSTDSIAPFSSAKLDIDLETPSTSKTVERSVSVGLASAKDAYRSVNVLVRYQLEGLMCFKDDIIMRELGDQTEVQRFSIPFVLTPPIAPSDIRFHFTPHSEGMLAVLTARDSSFSVDISIDPVFVLEDETNVTLSAVNDSADLSDTVMLSLMPVKPIQISPSRTTFRFTEVDWEASSVLRIRKNNDRVGAETAPFVEVLLNGKKINVESIRLAEGIYRLRLRSDNESKVANAKTSGKSTRLEWRVTTDSGVHRWESDFFFVPFPIAQPLLKGSK